MEGETMTATADEHPGDEVTDLLVIGAGINGAAVAREAALAGLRTVLVDAEDLAAGTSWTSGRLIHGGIRYLEHLEVRLVRESLRERERLLHTARHLVNPYPLLIPFYERNERSAGTLRLGMVAYDVLSLDKTSPRHRVFDRDQILQRYPAIDPEGLRGGALYHDAQAPLVERLVVEQAVDAAAAGARVLTHNRVIGIDRVEEAVEVTVFDPLTDLTSRLRSRVVINAAGPWVDEVLNTVRSGSRKRMIGGTKGSHLIVERFEGAPETGVHCEARSDGRAILVLPEPGDRYLIGTTDIFVDGAPDVVCSDEEIDYLLSEINALFPGARLRPEDVISTYSGIRPLPYQPDAKSPAHVSRDHDVLPDPDIPGLFNVVGGKLTTHRALGELATRTAFRFLAARGAAGQRHGRSLVPRRGGRTSARYHSPTRHLPLPGARTADWDAFAQRFTRSCGFGLEVAHRLLSLYGVRAEQVCALTREDDRLGEQVVGTDALAAEVVFAVREDFARTLIDVMARRLLLTRLDDVGLGCAQQVATICGGELGWSTDRVEREVQGFREWTRRLRPRALSDTPHAYSAGLPPAAS